MPLPAVLGGIIGGIQATSVFTNDKIVAYFIVLAVLFLDSSVSGIFGGSGVIGGFFSWILNTLFGVNPFIPTWALLVIFLCVPILGWAQSVSG